MHHSILISTPLVASAEQLRMVTLSQTVPMSLSQWIPIGSVAAVNRVSGLRLASRTWR
jgi:hypothetical protein